MLTSTRARIRSRCVGWGARLLFRRPFRIETDIPLISFTFDDFPRSALTTGGEILKKYNVRATYYAAFGLMGTVEPVGEIFNAEDLHTLVGHGHELGCHTFAHLNPATTSPGRFEESILQNRECLHRLLPGREFRTFSYPLCFPQPQVKKRAGRYFDCCRSGGQTLNYGTVDLNHLAAYFLEQSRDRPGAIRALIQKTKDARGWLILGTHDISSTASPYGCTPEFFEDVVKSAVRSGAKILPVAEALQILKRETMPVQN